MSTYVDDAVVLRRVDYGEADRVLTVLTRDHGKVGVIARGARKARARMGGQTDLFAHSRMQLARGRGELFTLTQAQQVGGAPQLGDPVRTACASVIGELADRVLEPHHPDAATYELVVTALNEIFASPRDPRAAMIWCARRLIGGLGYAPLIQSCAACEVTLPESPAWFSAAAGGLLCRLCASSDPGAVPCSVRVIKVLRCAQADDAETYGRIRFDDATLTTLEEVMEREIAHHLERGLRSLDVLRAIRR